MTDNSIPIDLFSSVSVVITPHEKGFTCGIVDAKPPSQRDICSYIAKGLVRFVTTNPDVIYEEGMQGFYEDDVDTETNKSNGNVIDLFNWKKGDLH
jgi:hypothetical protein